MNFTEALKTLGIEEYEHRILTSNSHGEMIHIHQYFLLAQTISDLDLKEWFKEWFNGIVEYAEHNWERPESVFQHVQRILNEQMREEMIRRNLL